MTAKASAPGRLDVMGGIADYSGSMVLQMPIAEKAHCVIELRSDELVRVRSTARKEPAEVELARLLEGGDLSSYEALRHFFVAHPSRRWASYVVGVISVLAIEEGVHFPRGLEISIDSEVPEGKGVSSSAALEVAVMRACLKLLDVAISPERVAALCQVAENRVAGAPCGIMDQMTASCGQKGRLMKLLCQPAELMGFVDLPIGTSVWGIDSGVRHEVSGSAYSDVRTAAFMGLRIIEDAAAGEGPDFGGYLANVGSAALKEQYGHLLPVRMEGSEFLARYGPISDTVVSVDPDKRYAVRAATVHPILEHERINRFAALLEAEPADPESCAVAGRLMFLSHEGYSSCGLGSEATDMIVSMVREAGGGEGLFGARITGGGSGGTVAVLGRDDAYGAIERVADGYERETGRGARIFET